MKPFKQFFLEKSKLGIINNGWIGPKNFSGDVSQIISNLVTNWGISAEDIAHGNCDEFAEELASIIGGEIYETTFDSKFPTHMWVKHNGKFYDSTHPNGVVYIKQLFKNPILEYRHNLADGTSAPSPEVNNGRNPNIVSPDKKQLFTKGDRKKDNPKMNVPGSILSPQELAKMGYQYEHGKVFNNVRNSGFGIEMTSVGGQPVGRVFKSPTK